MKKIEDLKQINEELEIFKKTNEHIIYNFEQLKEKCDESINKYIKKIEELENINNELLLKNRELEEKVKENENMIKCLENKTLEIILEQKQGKSKFFSIKNSINLSKSLEISTLKSELKSENSCDFDFQNNQNIISLEEKNDDETKKNEEIKNKENIIENSTKNNVNEIEKLKKVIEKIEKDLESSHLKSSKLCDQNQKFRMESFEMKNFNKKLSDELILIKNVFIFISY